MEKAKVIIAGFDSERVVQFKVSLRDLGYELITALDSVKSLREIAERERPDIVLIDFKTTRAEAIFKVIEELQHLLNIPVILITDTLATRYHSIMLKSEPSAILERNFSNDQLDLALKYSLIKSTQESTLHLPYRWLYTLLENLSDCIVATNNNLEIEYINPPALKISGYSQENVYGKKVYRILRIKSTRDNKPLGSLFSRVVRKKRAITIPVDALLLSKKGYCYNILGTINPLIDSSGKVIGTVTLLRDITEKLRAERIQNITYRIPQIARDCPDLLSFFKKTHELIKEVIDARNFYVALYNRKENLISFPYFIDEKDSLPEPRVAGRGLTEYLLRSGKSVIVDREKFNRLLKKGEIVVMGTPPETWLGVPLIANEEPIGAIVVQTYDKTHKYSESDLMVLEYLASQIVQAIEIQRKRSLESEFISLAQNMPILLVNIDKNGNLEYSNPQTKKFAEELNCTIRELLPENFSEQTQKFLSGDIKEPFLIITNQVGEHHIQWTLSPDFENQHVHFFGIDVTEQVKLQEQLSHAVKLEAIGRLAGGIAHDFNNILTVIMGYIQLIQMRTKKHDPIQKYLKQILQSADSAANLTRKLLTFSRHQTLQPRVLNLNVVLKNMEDMIRRLLREDISLEFELEEEIKPIRVDPYQIEQVVMNLVVNARDAMPEGGKLVIKTGVKSFKKERVWQFGKLGPGEFCYFQVIDTGIGMDTETIKRAIEPFFSTKQDEGGTGLGLSTVHGIITQSGGLLDIKSKVGQGTTMTIYLPVVEDEVEEVPSAEEEIQVSGGNETIMLVEDNDPLREVTSEILRHEGYKVLEAYNGGMAVLISDEYEGKIDLVITDVVMPKMSGTQLVRYLMKKRPEMKVIYISGYADDPQIQKDIVEKGFVFLQKPIDRNVLLKTIKQVLQPDK